MSDKGKVTSANASLGTYYSDINPGASYATFYGDAGKDVSSGTFYSQINGNADKKEAFTPKGTGGLALDDKKDSASSSTGASKSKGDDGKDDKARDRETVERWEGKRRVCDRF